ncbi:hypothetical protein RR46_06566 [Papilio xuthus]|uniref:Uncharacterized protein n=1 Tax=Papilio xuthus TaxID=66420 RepID=A0A194PSL6_PAPXU|nr:hypothetical protein RR46_06566 [Papilio xuthus]
MPISRRATCCRCELLSGESPPHRTSLSGEERPRGEPAVAQLHALRITQSLLARRRDRCVISVNATRPLWDVLRNKFDGKFVKFSERLWTSGAMCATTPAPLVTIV